jgi:hypothetical protein
MAIGKISGVMLKDNLERQGVNLSFDGNLLYLDVTARRLGVGTASPQYGLDVPANVRLANLTVLGNTITSNTGKIGLGSITSIVITGGSADYILKTDGAGNLSWIDANTSPALIDLLANIADYQTYANANAAFQTTSINAITANAGAFQTYANANLSTQTTNLNILDANVGAFETYANLSIASINSNVSNLIGNTIVLGSNSAPSLVSNAVALTTSTTVTDAISKLNFVLGKLVPPAPPTFPGTNTITISSLSTYRMTSVTQVDLTGNSRTVAAGTTVANVRRAASYSTTTVTTVGPGDSGTVGVYKNSTLMGSKAMATGSQNGTYGQLVIASDQDYAAITGDAGGFWESFNASATGSNVSPGWNEVYITHSSGTPTNVRWWYFDNSSPGTPVWSVPAITNTSNVVSYSSTVPHYTSSAGFTITANVTRLSGDMYPTSDSFITGTAAGAFLAPASITYATAGVTTPLAPNLYVASGSLAVTTTSNIRTGFGSSSTGPSITVDNSYATAAQAFTSALAATVLYKTGTATQIEETSMFIAASVGSGSGNPVRIVNPGTTDTPTYTASATAFNSTTGTLTANCATVVAATLKHDITNYASGHLPVGPNLSAGRHGAQYYTFKFTRTAVSKFDIKYTGTMAGLWVALPGSVIDTSSTLNGWLSMGIAYAGSGQPGAGTGGNGSNGCALGGLAVFNSAQTNKSVTATFGTVSSSSTATNEIYVRVRLNSGQTLTALTIEAATN